MSKVNWLKYRLDVVSRWPESECKAARLRSITEQLRAGAK